MAKPSIFTHDILPRINAGHNVLSIVTHEWERVEQDLISVSDKLGRRLLSWSSADNAIKVFEKDENGEMSWVNLKIGEDEIPIQFDDVWTSNIPTTGPDWVAGRVGRCAPDFLLWWYKENPDLHDSILWLRDITPYLDSTSHGATHYERRSLVRRIRDFCIDRSKVLRKTVVMTFPESYLPVELEKDVEQFTLPLPDESLMGQILKLEIKTWNEERPQKEKVKLPQGKIKQRLIRSALGLTVQEAGSAYRQIFARMTTGDFRKGDDFRKDETKRYSMREQDIDVLNEQKAQIINKTGVLEFIPHRESIADIGGMENLKEWLTIHKESLDDKKDPPKGLLMMGVPGCGKSLMARAVANEWKLPLLQLKASNIFDKYVGESEGKIARALAIAEACSPCVLWIDELEKLLAGSGGDGSLDSGVSARMGGAILSWMADKQTPVFVVATANNPERLDPAYVRRGRFDERFFIDLPSLEVRRQIFEIKLRERFPNMDMELIGLDALAEASPGYTGAEIEACVKEAKNMAKHQGMEMPDDKLLLNVVDKMIPDAVAMTETISHIRNLWGGDRARRADSGTPVDLDQESLNKKEVRDAVEQQKRSRIRSWDDD